MHLFLLAALLTQDDAEALYKKFEETLAKAKTLQFKFKVVTEVKAAGEDMKTDVSGEFAMRSDNRLRLWVEGKQIDQERRVGVVSDGTTLRRRDPEGPIDEKCPAKLSSEIRKVILRGGIYASFASGFGKLLTAVEGWKAAEYKLLEDEKVNDRTCKVLRFALATEVKSEHFIVKLWFDPDSGLPVKRLVTGGDNSIEMKMTETWEGAKLDSEIPDEEFEFEK